MSPKRTSILNFILVSKVCRDNTIKLNHTLFLQQYKLKPGPENDYALIKLKRKVEREKFTPLNRNIEKLKKNIKTAKLAIFGYLADKN